MNNPATLGKENAATDERFFALDGIRGWAALVVVVFHVFWETFGVVVPGFRNPLTSFALSAGLAVNIFFVLSGVALSAGFYRDGDARGVARLALTRFFRLAIPVTAASTIVFLLLAAGLSWHREAAQIVGRPDWLGSFLNFESTIKRLVRYCLYEAFAPINHDQAFIPFLWTMHFELVGSVLVFVALFATPYLKRPSETLGALSAALLVWNPFLSAFVVGMLLARARQSGALVRIASKPSAIVWSFAGIAAVAGAHFVADHFGVAENPRVTTVLSSALLGLVFVNPMLMAFFSNALSRFLGKISFPLYLLQFPVLISFTSWLIVSRAGDGGLTEVEVWAIGLASVGLCVLAAYVFVPVETWTRWFNRRLAKALIGLGPGTAQHPGQQRAAAVRGPVASDV